MTSSPRFPAIAISPGDSFFVVDDPIAKCSFKGWRNGFFDGLVYFDDSGSLWPVRATPLRPLRPWDRLRTSIPLEVRYDEPMTDGRGRAAELLIDLVRNDPGDLYNQWVSHATLESLIRQAHDPQALIEVARHLGSVPHAADEPLGLAGE